MSTPRNRAARLVLAAALTTALAGCVGGQPSNASLYSVHQPVVERSSYTLDINTLPGGGVPVSEQRRLAGWFESLGLGYGDKVALDDPAGAPATRDAVQAVLSAHGLMLADTPPVTAGNLAPGTARLVILRTTASVPGCPDWSTHNDGNGRNATSTNYGCAVNSNIAAMVANKEDLVHGQTGDGRTTVMSSNKAIQAYRETAPSGGGGSTVKKVNTSNSGSN
ncbi:MULTISPECIES: CpaD family pilus assembly protein [unclassified Novosphingobium]|uniref:CpaD family pilus assembly protein n=1 Tax=Novosphingobium TaxID=165696 RepID=UPI00146DE272|nr:MULTISPECIES: CpaD family pilus assembly protein [unclassified Novosphingobium]NMN03235.1 pilus assembly protein CpaD [Novosphingobium sp. SG919]NMN86775.1 pilus assembly protein CpaD [Novosphingobium sp. SG916]